MEIDYSKYDLSNKEKYRFLATGYACIFAVMYLYYHSLFFSFAGGALVLCCITPYKAWKAEKRRTLLLTQFKDLLYSLSSYTAANLQLSEALEGSLENMRLLYDEDSPLVVELDYMVRNIKENQHRRNILFSNY